MDEPKCVLRCGEDQVLQTMLIAEAIFVGTLHWPLAKHFFYLHFFLKKQK